MAGSGCIQKNQSSIGSGGMNPDNVVRFPAKGGINEDAGDLKGRESVDWQEKYVEKLNQYVSEIKADMKNMESRLGDKIEAKLEVLCNEIRHLDSQRHQEILAMQQRIDNSIHEVKVDIISVKSDVNAVKNEIKATNKCVMGLVVAASLSFLGIAISLSIGMFNVINIIKNLVVK